MYQGFLFYFLKPLKCIKIGLSFIIVGFAKISRKVSSFELAKPAYKFVVGQITTSSAIAKIVVSPKQYIPAVMTMSQLVKHSTKGQPIIHTLKLIV